MIPPSFEYLTPSNISDAVALLQKHGDEAKILAGGHSLIPAMRLRLAEPGYLIDISGIGGLDYIQEESGQLRICLLYTSPSPRDRTRSRMPSSA